MYAARPREHLREAADRREQHRDRRGGRRARIALAERAPQAVVDDPAGEQRAHRQRDRDDRIERPDVRIDEERRAVEVVDDDHQRDAGHPGEAVLPLEPVQRGRHLARREQLLLDVVERAGVDHEDLALRERRELAVLLEVAIEPVEQHRVADPHDPRDQVGPAKYNIEQLVQTQARSIATTASEILPKGSIPPVSPRTAGSPRRSRRRRRPAGRASRWPWRARRRRRCPSRTTGRRPRTSGCR